MVDCSGVLQKFNGNDNVFLSFLPLSPFYNLPRNTILHSTYRTVKVLFFLLQYQNYLMYISYLSSIVSWPPLIFCSLRWLAAQCVEILVPCIAFFLDFRTGNRVQTIQAFLLKLYIFSA